MMKNTSTLLSISIGFLMGILIFVCPIIFLIMCILSLISLCLNIFNSSERTFLYKILSINIILKLLFCELMMFIIYCHFSDFLTQHPLFSNFFSHNLIVPFRDYSRELLNGFNIANYFKEQSGFVSLSKIPSTIAVEGRGTYLNFSALIHGVLNYLFGLSFLNSLIPALFSLFLIIFTFIISKQLFGKEVAYISSILIALWPSTIIWSCTNIRTTMGIFCFLMTVFFIIQFYRTSSTNYLLLLILTSWILALFKIKFLEANLFISFFLLFFILKLKQDIKILILFAVLYISFYFPAIQTFYKNVLIDIIGNHIAFHNVSFLGSVYKIYPLKLYSTSLNNNFTLLESYSLKELFLVNLKALPQGIKYFLFSPFPWEITNSSRLFFYPQSIFWYVILFFSTLGIRRGFQLHKYVELWIIVTFIAFWISILALCTGNEGIAARHRDLIAPFIMILSGLGLTSVFQYKEGFLTTPTK